MNVIVTGASGVLGSAVYAAFKAAGHNVLGLAHSRSTNELKAVDLLDSAAVQQAFAQFGKPDWVIHCAAERRPDVAEKVCCSFRVIAERRRPGEPCALADSQNFTLVYISTAVLGVVGARCIVLRVPVLYGPAPKNTDSAVNVLLDIVTDQTGKQYTMDHYATRYPTNVVDIAGFLARLTTVTKYEMCLVFARILGVPHAHIVPDAEPPTVRSGDGAPARLPAVHARDGGSVDDVGGLGWTPFEEWWREHIARKQ
ncbi:NAD(P)-binding protein [Amylocystis lapponica]|nr:NAD(P)-binding protein [Amylocystis lapponica]